MFKRFHPIKRQSHLEQFEINNKLKILDVKNLFDEFYKLCSKFHCVMSRYESNNFLKIKRKPLTVNDQKGQKLSLYENFKKYEKFLWNVLIKLMI